jgi:hypothetical protein
VGLRINHGHRQGICTVVGKTGLGTGVESLGPGALPGPLMIRIRWPCSGVGRETFVKSTKENLGLNAKGRAVIGEDGSCELKESSVPYKGILGRENAPQRFQIRSGKPVDLMAKRQTDSAWNGSVDTKPFESVKSIP